MPTASLTSSERRTSEAEILTAVRTLLPGPPQGASCPQDWDSHTPVVSAEDKPHSDPRAPWFHRTLHPGHKALFWTVLQEGPRYSPAEGPLKNLAWLPQYTAIREVTLRQVTRCFIQQKGKRNQLRHNFTLFLAFTNLHRPATPRQKLFTCQEE